MTTRPTGHKIGNAQTGEWLLIKDDPHGIVLPPGDHYWPDIRQLAYDLDLVISEGIDLDRADPEAGAPYVHVSGLTP